VRRGVGPSRVPRSLGIPTKDLPLGVSDHHEGSFLGSNDPQTSLEGVAIASQSVQPSPPAVRDGLRQDVPGNLVHLLLRENIGTGVVSLHWCDPDRGQRVDKLVVFVGVSVVVGVVVVVGGGVVIVVVDTIVVNIIVAVVFVVRFVLAFLRIMTITITMTITIPIAAGIEIGASSEHL